MPQSPASPVLASPVVHHPHATTGATKRAVNLTLSDALVSLARGYTTNLSATVEVLLLEYVATQQRAKGTRQQQADGWSKEWNALGAAVGSFADEHTTI